MANTADKKEEWIKLFVEIAFASIILYFLYELLNGLFKTGSSVIDTAGSITDKFGITQSAGAKELKTQPAFKMNYYTGQEPPSRDYNFFYDLAHTIYDAKVGSFYTNDSEIYGAFNSLFTKKDISYLSRVFYYLFNQDLLNYFYKPMTDDYLSQLNDLVKTLPN